MFHCHKIVVCRRVTTYLAEVGNFFPPVGDGQEVRGQKFAKIARGPLKKFKNSFQWVAKIFESELPFITPIFKGVKPFS